MNKRSGIESRKKIMSAAGKVFSEYGYRGASMRMIAKESGVSLGGPYLYFRNKEQLYTTLLSGRLDDLARNTSEAVKDIDDPAVALSTFISMRLDYARKHRELILLQGKEHGFDFAIKAKRRFFRQQREVVKSIIRKGIDSGRFRKCDVEEVSKVIVCVLRGFILSIIVEPDVLFSAEECSGLFLKGLLNIETMPHATKTKERFLKRLSGDGRKIIKEQ
jgi:AcrR family transcriptional regulator